MQAAEAGKMISENATLSEQRSYVRALAAEVMERVSQPRMAAVRKLWCDVNSRRPAVRAPVYCRPVGCWSEILPQASLLCRDQFLRSMEYSLRQSLCKLDIGDDDPLLAYWPVYARFRCEPANIWGVAVGRHAAASAGGAWGYDPPLKTEKDFDSLAIPQFTYDKAASAAALSRVQEVLAGIMPVKLVASEPLNATLGTAAAGLRGLSEIMMDMIDAPELMHRLMAFLRDSCLAGMKAVEDAGLVMPNNEGAMIESEPLPVGDSPWKQRWNMANSQEFDQVSPDMWEEFCLAYQRPILEKYGAVSYGCCENLTRKADGVLSIPNLRIFVCSAWSNLDTVIEKAGGSHTIMWRQKASDVAMPPDMADLRRNMERDLAKLKGCSYQIVLRELQTLNNHPRRLHDWTAMAKDLAAKHV